MPLPARTPLMAGTETLVGIDYRPETGQLYGLGIDPVAETGTLYRIDPQTGAASLAVAGTASLITFATEDFPPATAGYGVDFNPNVDQLRVVTATGLNFRVDPATGLPVIATTDTDITGPVGLTGVSERLAALGGSLQIARARQGLSVAATIPLAA